MLRNRDLGWDPCERLCVGCIECPNKYPFLSKGTARCSVTPATNALRNHSLGRPWISAGSFSVREVSLSSSRPAAAHQRLQARWFTVRPEGILEHPCGPSLRSAAGMTRASNQLIV